MTKELAFYTGKIKYKEIDFNFVFDGEELRLISPVDKKNEVRHNILMNKISDGVYTFASPTMEDAYLIGVSHETGQTLIFLTKQWVQIGCYNEVLFVKIAAYIICKSESNPISKMSFACPELDCVHPVTQGYHCKLKQDDFNNHGILSVTMENYDTTNTKPQNFDVDGKDIQVSFGISRSFSTKVGQPPLTLYSTMIFEFEPTDDYSFVARLWFIAKEFVQFLCYRRNVFIPVAYLSTPAEEGKPRTFAELHWLKESGDNELNTLEKGRYIRLSYLSGKEGEILNDIAAKKLYTKHIPETYASGCSINAARFVMITAAFEWEFKRTYPDGVKKSDKTLEIERTATETIQGLIDGCTGALKEKYKFLKKLIKSDSLQSEIVHTCNDLDEIIGIFGKRLYSLNNTNLRYCEMGQRLASQRNNFAHGNLDIDFIDNALLDLVFLERIVYAMQLKRYGISEKNIQHAVNDLFRCGVLIS